MSADPDVPLASEALLRPVRPGNAFEDTVQRLLQTIRLGMLAPGASLPPERELAARLGVSRDTVREAIKSLADAGYLVSHRTLTAAEREVLWSRVAGVSGAVPDDYRRLDSRLHLAIAEAAGSPSLVPLVAENRMRLNGLLDQIPLLPRNIAHSDEQHEAIVMAILAGDGEGAAEAMRAHVAGSAALLHGFLD
jgi:DNA-binding FadR family transcriptional regulator